MLEKESKINNYQIKRLYEILLSNDVVKSINDNMEYLLDIIPEIKNMIDFPHNNPHHHLDVWKHTLYALSLSDCDFDVRLTLLLHDIGKPFSYQDDEIRHFHNHPEVSYEMSRIILNRLNFNKDYIEEICYLIKYHDDAITESDILNNYELAYKRYQIQECDALAHHPEKLEKRKRYLERTRKLLNY